MPALQPVFLCRPIAHRALHNIAQGRIENSASAIRAAIAEGYGIEIDLQLSSDGVAMVFHDETLDRLTDRIGPVDQVNAADLGRTVLSGGTDTVPTLAQVLALVAGRVPLLIEIKDRSGALSETDGRLERATAAALAGYDGPVALMSFNPHSVLAMARLAPSIPRGLTTAAFDAVGWAPVPKATCDRLRDIPDYDATGASFISHEAADLGRARVAELKTQGAAILCWTIRSVAAEVKARRIADTVTFEGYAADLTPSPAMPQ